MKLYNSILNKKQALQIFSILKKYFGTESIIELNYLNNYTLLVSTLLSAQATDKSVNKVSDKLFKEADTPEKMLKLGEDKINSYIKSINYHNVKAKNIMKLSKKLVEKFNSVVPNTREELMELDGVGRKTANIVLNIAFGQNAIAVDTHVFRVSNRIGLVNTNKVLDTELGLYKILDKNDEYIKYANYWLVLLGRYTCKSLKPNCSNCPISNLCIYNKNT